MAFDYSFTPKSDNFLDLPRIHNMAVAALADEEIVGSPEMVGTLQLYNKNFADISQNDLARISYIRKLIGSTLIKCDFINSTLQTILGMAMCEGEMKGSVKNVQNMIAQQ